MEKNLKIEDESGDRKYFTQVPNMVVNHSTAYEQSLYLIMKRLAGEHGSCFASLNSLAGKMGVHKTTVSQTIQKLLKREWVKEMGKKKIKGGSVRQFVIVDLWKINLKEYGSGADVTTSGSGAVVNGSGAIIDGSGAKSDTKKNQEEELEEEPIVASKDNIRGTNPLIVETINLFSFNPTYKEWYKNKTQRAAAQWLIEEYGMERLRLMVAKLPAINAKKYAPTTTTPLELKNNIARIKAFIQKERAADFVA